MFVTLFSDVPQCSGRRTAGGGQRTVDGRRAADGGQRAAGGGQRTADGGRSGDTLNSTDVEGR